MREGGKEMRGEERKVGEAMGEKTRGKLTQWMMAADDGGRRRWLRCLESCRLPPHP